MLVDISLALIEVDCDALDEILLDIESSRDPISLLMLHEFVEKLPLSKIVFVGNPNFFEED